MRAFVLVTALLAGCAGPRHDVAAPAAEASAPVDWQAWSPEAFAAAKRDGRMIVVDVGIEGCTACRWMEEKTYADPRVRALLAEHFVTISVDAEARPDIGERYEYWAWPATIFMSPGAEQVLAIRGNKLPQNFIPILEQLIAAKAAGTLTGDGKQPITAPPRALEGPLEALRSDVVARMDRSFDETVGGWGRRLKAPAGPHVVHAFLRAHARDEAAWRERALKTLRGMARLIDPHWGGVFVAGVGGWGNIVPEKRIAGQAAALRGFAEAYALTHDAAWVEHAKAVDRYVRRTLQASDGTFYTSQEDDAPDLPADMGPRDYYDLPGDAREAYGTPPVDHAVYTDKNALAIRAYVALANATGDAQYLETATTAAERLVAQRQTEAGWFEQFAAAPDVRGDDRMRALPEQGRAYLRPQGPMGLAMLDLYAAGAGAQWLARAQQLATGLRSALEDPAVGGFFDTDDDATDNIVPRRKSVEANAQAGQFLYLLSVYTKNEDHRAAAERTVRAVSHPEVLRREGRAVADLAILLELLVTGYVEFTVVGDAADPAAKALFSAAAATYEPRKVIHHEAPGRYPDQGEPALFICSDNACSPPIMDPTAVPDAAARFAGLRG